MVFFNCNACGEALKKNQVEKHTLRCRSCEVLSCVDCGKDFWGNDYQTHIKCMSEEQKYCGKGYVPKVNKGEVKQEQWIEKVQHAIERSMSNPKLKGLLERLKDYPNIPRKKAKFENFLKNSLRIHSESLISQVWEMLMASSGQENGKDNSHAKADKTINDVKENGDIAGKAERKKVHEQQEKNTNVSTDNIEGKQKKEKKKKHSEREETIQEESTGSSDVSCKQTKAEVQENSDTVVHGETIVDEHKLSKRQRKEERRKKANKKEKKDKTENISSNEEKRTGKKIKFSENEEVIEEDVEEKAAEDSDKKKKKTVSESKADDVLEKGSKSERKISDKNNEVTISEKKNKDIVPKKKKKFNWEAIVFAVLRSKGEMPLKRLQKKVLTEFAAQEVPNYSGENLKAKFEKKLKKMRQVKVIKDRVTLRNAVPKR